MKLNKAYLLIMALVASPVYALPIPEFTSAFLGLGELLLIIMAGLTLYFPFLKKFNNKNKYIYLVLLLSILCNIYYFTSDMGKNSPAENEDRPGMVWEQSQRNNDPHAIDEKEAYKLLVEQQKSGQNKYIFVDARSKSETELGTAQGFLKMKWPDLRENYSLEGKKVILTCWTGMRGSEICDILRSLGIDCQYLKGGLKGWMAAGLPVSLEKNVTPEEFGTAEPFNNSSKIFTAREAVKAVQAGAIIVDMRKPPEFLKKSIAKSINVNYSQLTTPALEYAIYSIPVKKVVVACYGTFSCSEASALGWEMHRMGYQYLGAYSGGIDAFNNVNAPKKISSYDLLHNFMVYLFNYWALKIPVEILVLLASLSLGIILFVTKNMSLQYFKSFNERNHKKKQLQNKLNDEWVINRELQLNYKKDLKDITTSFCVLVLALMYSFVIDIIYNSWGKGFIFGIDHWQDKIGISIWAAFLSLAISIALNMMVFKKINGKLWLGILLVFIVGFFTTQALSKISSFIFLITFTVMYFIQIGQYINKIYHKYKVKNDYTKGYVSLSDATEVIPEGTKAYHLSHLKNKGFNTPDGFVVTRQFKNSNILLKSLGTKFAVRSSALNEDQKDSSHAGLNLSVVPSYALESDIQRVFDSYKSNQEKEIVLIQKLIEPKFAGVIFSKHPSWGGTALIEWGEGLAGKRMDGSENANSIVIERVNGSVVYGKNIGIDTARLYKLLNDVETHYKIDMDIEWAIDTNDELWLLQARPQTALEQYNRMENERQTLLKPGFKGLKACELSWGIDTPLSASLVCKLWESGGSADKASRMALWNWKINSSQPAYVYAFGRIWDSSGVQLSPPDKINWMMGKREFKENLLSIEKNKNDLINQNEINKSVLWNSLDNHHWLVMWQIALKNWMQMQEYAFYFEFMAQSAIDDCKKEKDFQNDYLKCNFYTENVGYRSEKDYELSMPRYIETIFNKDEISRMLFGNVCKANNDENKNDIKNASNKLKVKLDFANRLIYLRDEYKHHSLSFYYILRLGLLDLKNRVTGDVYQININDMQEILNGKAVPEAETFNNNLTEKMDAQEVALWGRTEKIQKTPQGVISNHKTDETKLKGIFVSHPQNLTGMLLKIKEDITVLEMENILMKIESDTILYSKFISPHLVSLAQKYKVLALISLYGSTLSHPSILAREAKIPFLTGINLTHWDNEKLIIDLNGNVQLF